MNEIELAQKLAALNEYTNNRRHELHDSDAKPKPDLGELWKALQAVGLNPASGGRLVFEVTEALAADPEAKINNIVVTLGEGDKRKTFALNKRAESGGCKVWNLG